MRGEKKDKIISDDREYESLSPKLENFRIQQIGNFTSATKVLKVDNYNILSTPAKSTIDHDKGQELPRVETSQIQSEIIRKFCKPYKSFEYSDEISVLEEKHDSIKIFTESLKDNGNKFRCPKDNFKKEDDIQHEQLFISTSRSISKESSIHEYILNDMKSSEETFKINEFTKSAVELDSSLKNMNHGKIETYNKSIEINQETVVSFSKTVHSNEFSDGPNVPLKNNLLSNNSGNTLTSCFQKMDRYKVDMFESKDLDHYSLEVKNELESKGQKVILVEMNGQTYESLSFILSFDEFTIRQVPRGDHGSESRGSSKYSSNCSNSESSSQNPIRDQSAGSGSYRYGGGGGGDGGENPQRLGITSNLPADYQEDPEQILDKYLAGENTGEQIPPIVQMHADRFFQHPKEGGLRVALEHFTMCSQADCQVCARVLDLVTSHLNRCSGCDIYWCQQYHDYKKKSCSTKETSCLLKDEKIVKHLGRIFQEQLRRETTQTHGDENNIPSYNDTSYTSSYISDNEVIYSDNYDDFREFQNSTHNQLTDENINKGVIRNDMRKKIVINRKKYKMGIHYEKLCVLGGNKGRQGKVFKVQDKESRFIFALKQEPLKNQADKKLTEIETWAKVSLAHTEIIGLYGVVCENENLNIFMEFLDGEDLESMVRRSQKLSPKQSMFYILKVCKQLEILHDADIIHEDIKAENVMVQSHDTIKLVDFGLSQFNKLKSSKARGSRFAFSPEKARGNYNISADVWAIGQLANHLITGKRPWAEDRGEILFSIGNCRSPPISKDLQKIIANKPAIKQFFDATLSINPKSRLTIKELINNDCFRPFDSLPENKQTNTLARYYLADSEQRSFNEEPHIDITTFSEEQQDDLSNLYSRVQEKLKQYDFSRETPNYSDANVFGIFQILSDINMSNDTFQFVASILEPQGAPTDGQPFTSLLQTENPSSRQENVPIPTVVLNYSQRKTSEGSSCTRFSKDQSIGHISYENEASTSTEQAASCAETSSYNIPLFEKINPKIHDNFSSESVAVTPEDTQDDVESSQAGFEKFLEGCSAVFPNQQNENFLESNSNFNDDSDSEAVCKLIINDALDDSEETIVSFHREDFDPVMYALNGENSWSEIIQAVKKRLERHLSGLGYFVLFYKDTNDIVDVVPKREGEFEVVIREKRPGDKRYFDANGAEY